MAGMDLSIPDVHTQTLLSPSTPPPSAIAENSRRATSSCNTSPSPSAEKAQCYTYQEEEMPKGVPSIITGYNLKCKFGANVTDYYLKSNTCALCAWTSLRVETFPNLNTMPPPENCLSRTCIAPDITSKLVLKLGAGLNLEPNQVWKHFSPQIYPERFQELS